MSQLRCRRHGCRGKRFRVVGMHHHQSMLLARLHCQHRGFLVSIDVSTEDETRSSLDLSDELTDRASRCRWFIQYDMFGEIRKFPKYFRVSRNDSWIIVPVHSSPSCSVTHLGFCLSVCFPDVTEIRAKPSLKPHVTQPMQRR